MTARVADALAPTAFYVLLFKHALLPLIRHLAREEEPLEECTQFGQKPQHVDIVSRCEVEDLATFKWSISNL